jgi:methyl-accepting chemotaxis protein/methyl-accepting chemotaxis protein-1 (serine sensor receptor)
MKIGTKLMASFSLMLGLVLALGIGAGVAISHLGTAMDRTVNVAAKRALLASRIVTETANIVAVERGIVLRSILQQTAAVDKHKQEFHDAASRIDEALGQLQPLMDTDASQQGLTSLRAQLSALRQAHREMLDALDRQQFDLVQKTSEEKVMPRALDIGGGAAGFLEQANRNMAEAAQSAESAASASRWMVLCLAALGVGAGVVVLGAVRRINTVLRRLSAELAERAELVAGAAAQVSSSSQALAQSSSQQAASLEETAASSQELASQTRKNLEAARAGAAGMGFAVVADEVRNLAQRCAGAAGDTAALIEESIATSNGGKQKLAQVVAAIQSITGSSAQVKALVNEVDRGSREQSRSIEHGHERSVRSVERARCAVEGAGGRGRHLRYARGGHYPGLSALLLAPQRR